MTSEPIGHTPCADCCGVGKNDDETTCPTCQGAGLVPVFKQPAAVGTQPAAPPGRRFSRYYTDLPITIRDQQERELAGRCVVIAEGGLAAILPEPISVGSVVKLQLHLPTYPTAIAVWAIVRNELRLRHGFEFVSLTDLERAAIRRFCNCLGVQWDVERRHSSLRKEGKID
jgi:hypothetical protein